MKTFSVRRCIVTKKFTLSNLEILICLSYLGVFYFNVRHCFACIHVIATGDHFHLSMCTR